MGNLGNTSWQAFSVKGQKANIIVSHMISVASTQLHCHYSSHRQYTSNHSYRTSLVAQTVKKSACNAGDLCLTAELGRSPREGKGYPLYYCCLKNSMDRETWQVIVRGLQRVRHNQVLSACTHTHTHTLGIAICIVFSVLYNTWWIRYEHSHFV